MAENDTLTAAKGLLEALDRHTPSEDWLRTENAPSRHNPGQPSSKSLLETARWFAAQVVDASGRTLWEGSPKGMASIFQGIQARLETIAGFNLEGVTAATPIRRPLTLCSTASFNSRDTLAAGPPVTQPSGPTNRPARWPRTCESPRGC